MNTNLLVINSGVAIKYILHIDIPNIKWNRNGKKLLLQKKKNQSTNNYTLIQYKYRVCVNFVLACNNWYTYR